MLAKHVLLLRCLQILISVSKISAYPSRYWQDVTNHLNYFRSMKAVSLQAANLQKIYWDENLEYLAHRKLERLIENRKPDRSTAFWIRTNESDPKARAAIFLETLTKSDEHNHNMVNEETIDKAFNLAINHGTIRMGCVDLRRKGSYYMLCVFGPSPLKLNDQLYSRGEVCSDCPMSTGCSNNLCDEKTKASLPPIIEILGLDMTRSTQIYLISVLSVSSAIFVATMIVVYVCFY